MASLSDQLNEFRTAALQALASARTREDLEQLRARYLGRKGELAALLRGVAALPAGERQAAGAQANRVREEVEQAFAHARTSISTTPPKRFDVSIPGHPPGIGHLHPLTLVQRDIEDAFLSMGFALLDGPHVEESRYNFDLLNIPLEHPARDLMDTYWLSDGRLLRTHTSAAQARVMANRIPPFRILIPGRVFRHEATDATHESTFHHFEGLYVDADVSLAHLKGILNAILPRIIRAKVQLRFRPSYFPFVEPGVEVDLSCLNRVRSHAACGVCKGSGWVEVMGAGMIHPVVLQNVAIDPRRYRGFAFGGSIDRLAMLRYGINDIRLFWSGDPHFLQQFS